jgi:hypothetical protein
MFFRNPSFMAVSTPKIRVVSWLKSCGFIYDFLKRVLRWPHYLTIEVSRIMLAPARFGPPVGFYSALEAYSPDRIRILIHGQILPELPHRSLIRMAGMDQNGQQPWPIFTAFIPDARLVGGSLAPMDDRKRLLKEACYGDRYCMDEPSFNQCISYSSLALQGDWTSVTGRFSSGYYHWMTDDLPRLASLIHMPANTRILIREPMRKYQRESLKLLGLEERVHPVSGRHFTVERFHFSSPVGMTGCTNPFVVSWLREQYSGYLRPDTGLPEKLFVLRRGKTRGLLNQDELAEYLMHRGWVPIDLEECSFERQITLFANASQIIAEHGAALTNLLWCRPGTKVLELCAHNFLNGCYEGIALCTGLDHRFEIFEADRANRIHVPLEKLLVLVKGW